VWLDLISSWDWIPSYIFFAVYISPEILFLRLMFGIIRCSPIQTAIRLTTGPQPLPKLVHDRVRSSASSFKCFYPFISVRSSNSCLRILPRLFVTSVLPFIFLSIKHFGRQFLTQDVTYLVSVPFFIVCRIFLSSLTLCYSS